MKLEVVHDIEASRDAVLVWVSDLSAYPQWTGLLHRVEAESVQPGEPRAWSVELRGKIGPFARSKRLRMVEVPGSSSDVLRFERSESDGRPHGEWNLDVSVRSVNDTATHLVVVFEYRGRLWSTAVERLLKDEIEASKRRLSELATGGGQSADQAP